MPSFQSLITVGCVLCLALPEAIADTHFLVIGGGYAPEGNQASLEKNVLYFRQVLAEQGLADRPTDVYFADGTDSKADLQVMDRESIPIANRLMAEFFGSNNDLGLMYRNHGIENVRGSTHPGNLRRWFNDVGRQLQPADHLLIYVTSHGEQSGDRRNEYDTTISLWGDRTLPVSEFTRLLDSLPADVRVTVVMVQCHSGGFARFIFNGGDPDRGVSAQNRCGFFATVHDRAAAGCTPEIDEATYVEYSTYFWNALAGHDRLGNPIDVPDYDASGTITFDEAHAYTVLTADTIDLPITTSSEFLRVHSKFGKSDSDLLTNEEPFSDVLQLATPVQRAILEGLSDQLELTGDDRAAMAWRESQPRRGPGSGRFRGRRPSRPGDELRRTIRADLEDRWPQLANLLNPVCIDLLTTRSEEFTKAVQQHPDYARYREEVDNAPPQPDEQKRRVRYERFLRVLDDVVLAENLKRIGNEQRLTEYRRIVAGESGTLRD